MQRHALYNEDTLVIGLGRFGTAVATEMHRMGYRVHAIEARASLAERHHRRFQHVMAVDSTDPEELGRAKLEMFRVAVVAIGSSVEASLLTAGNLVDAGVPSIWAKAVSEEHARILERIGVHHVVFPEADSGRRVAHLVNDKLRDYIEFDDGYAIAKMTPPHELLDKTLAESQVRSRYGVTVVGMKAPGDDFHHAVPGTMVGRHHSIIVSGPVAAIERLASRP